MVLPDDIITHGPTSPVELKGVGSSLDHAQWEAWPIGRGVAYWEGAWPQVPFLICFRSLSLFLFFLLIFLTLFIKLWLKGGADKQWPYANEGGVASLPR